MDPISEGKLREIVREEIEKVVAELSAEKLREAKEGIPVRLGNPSFASMIPTDPFPPIKAEEVRKRIEEMKGIPQCKRCFKWITAQAWEYCPYCGMAIREDEEGAETKGEVNDSGTDKGGATAAGGQAGRETEGPGREGEDIAGVGPGPQDLCRESGSRE